MYIIFSNKNLAQENSHAFYIRKTKTDSAMITFNCQSYYIKIHMSREVLQCTVKLTVLYTLLMSVV